MTRLNCRYSNSRCAWVWSNCRRVFRAGLRHSMVDACWPEFERVFHGFNVRAVAAMSDEALEHS